jgi:hypothetical protein
VRLRAAWAAWAAASRLFLAGAIFDFVEEVPSDDSCMRTGGMECDGDAFIDAALKAGEVGNDGRKDFGAEGVSDLSEIGHLKRSCLLELGYEVPKELQIGIVVLLHALDDSSNGRGTTGSPVSCLQGDYDTVGCAESRIAGQRNAGRTVEEHVLI